MSKRNILLLLVVLFCSISVNAQSLVVTLKSGSSSTYLLTTIRSIKFGESTMILKGIDGTTNTWQISEINNYSFTGLTNTSEEINALSRGLDIYPTPATDVVYINFRSEQLAEIKIEVIDSKGSLLETIFEGKHQGEHRYQWNTQQTKGNYYCRITSNNLVVTKPILIQ